MEKIIKFINENTSKVIIILLILLSFFYVKSCTRGNKIEKLEKKITAVRDSSKIAIDSIDKVAYQYKTEKEQLAKDTAKLNDDLRYQKNLNMAQANKKVEVTNNNKTTVVAQKQND